MPHVMITQDAWLGLKEVLLTSDFKNWWDSLWFHLDSGYASRYTLEQWANQVLTTTGVSKWNSYFISHGGIEPVAGIAMTESGNITDSEGSMDNNTLMLVMVMSMMGGRGNDNNMLLMMLLLNPGMFSQTTNNPSFTPLQSGNIV